MRAPSNPRRLHALILAAGMGTRLGAITRERPKALVEIGGESLIARIIRQCVTAGVSDIHIVVGYRADEIRTAVGAIDAPITVTYVESPDYMVTNNIVSLQKGLTHLAETARDADILLIECDVVVDDSVIDSLVTAEKDNIAVVSPFEPGMDGTVVRITDGLVHDLITTKHQGQDFNFTNTFKTVNVYRLSRDLWVSKLPRLLDWYIDEVGVMNYYEHAIGMFAYASGDDLHAMVIDSSLWNEVDDPYDLRLATYRFSEVDRLDMLTSSHGGWWDFDVTDYSYLRNMYFPTPALIAQLKHHLEAALHNYGSGQLVLDEKMSWLIDSDKNETLALAGLASLYPSVTDLLDRSSALLPYPTFGEYSARYPAASRYDASLDIDGLRAAIEAGSPEVVVVVNPNNPTGTLHSSGDLVDLARQHPQVLFLIDESFLPFTDEESMRHLVSAHGANVLVVASLSKNMGVPGLRIGYAWSRDTALIDRLRQKIPIWAMNSLSEVFLTLLLKFRREYTDSMVRSRADKAEFELVLSGLDGAVVTDGVHGDFCLVHLPGTAVDESGALASAMLRRGYLIKDVAGKFGADHPVLRIAVRTPHENHEFARHLAEVLAEVSGG